MTHDPFRPWLAFPEFYLFTPRLAFFTPIDGVWHLRSRAHAGHESAGVGQLRGI